MQHRPAPDEGLVPGIKKTDRNGLQSMDSQRLDAIVPQDFRLFARSKHQRDVRTVDIGVEEPHAMAQPGKDNRQVNGQSGLADSSLARTDGDDGIDAGERLRSGLLLTRMGMSAQLSLIAPAEPGRIVDYTGCHPALVQH